MASNDEDDLADAFLDLGRDDDALFFVGAAADVADAERTISALPRLFRVAALARGRHAYVRDRIAADIATTLPAAAEQASAWAAHKDDALGIALAERLDLEAVTRDQVTLRGLADSVRMISLPAGPEHGPALRRIGKALLLSEAELDRRVSPDLRADASAFALAWGCMASNVANDFARLHTHAVDVAIGLAERLRTRVAHAVDESRDRKAEAETPTSEPAKPATSEAPVAPGFVRVARVPSAETFTAKGREVMRGIEQVLKRDMPVVAAPANLHAVRNVLANEFPYAVDVIDILLADMVTARFARIRPTIIQGDPGGGKSRLVRRLAEELHVFLWRVDCGRSDSGAFGGSDRRWHGTEVSQPLLAIGRGGHANPMILLDEADKAAAREDYGTLFNAILPMLEPETAAALIDPALQTPVNLSFCSFVATVNAVTRLPGPLLDRCRLIHMPQPRHEHLDALLPGLLADIARADNLDPRWIEPLDADERRAIARLWKHRSVRALRRATEAVVRARAKIALHH